MAVLPIGIGSAGGTPAGAVERSLRFNSADSAFLSRTLSSSGNMKVFTLSFWLKRTALGVINNLFTVRNGIGSGAEYFQIKYNANDTISVIGRDSGSVVRCNVSSTAVFRDPGAWAHIVISFNASSTTLNVYANNVVIANSTSIGNVDYSWNNSSLTYHRIGDGALLGEANLNGYMAELYHVDGQPLTPSDFGETDTNTGVWKPKAFSGTYGTNGFYLPFKTASQWSGFFDGSNDYLSVASNAAWQYGTGDFTVECWLLGTSSGAFSNQYIFGRYNTSAGTYGALQIGNSTTIYWYYANGGAYSFTLGTALTTNRWYHFAVSRSGTSLRFFLDGTQIGSTQTDSTNYSGTAEFRIINAHQSSATYFPGYISNVRVVKGSAVYTANFTPSTQSLTAITNTVLLTCQSSTFIDNSTNNFTITNNGGVITQQFSPFTLDVTDDHSGQGNHWIPNNLDLRTTGVGADILVDSPTAYGTDTGVGGEVRGNYCTFNPLNANSAITLSNGNLTITQSNNRFCGTTIPVASGKWYFEYLPANTGTGNSGIGVIRASDNVFGSDAFSAAGSYAGVGYLSSGNKNVSGTITSYGATYVSGDVIGVAIDLDSGTQTITFYKNNTSQGSINIPTASQTWMVVCDGATSVSANINFGQRAFAYTAPSGFKALCTQNLPTPTIGATSTTQANDYFNVLTYTGNSTARSITGVGFQPDFTWIKMRSGTSNHALFDSVRGATQWLASNLTQAETTDSVSLTSFNSDGFSLGTGANLVAVNNNTSTFVAWNWKANGAGSSNTAGQITSTVSANNDAGFSIVTYTGNGSANQTVGHGCKVGGVATAPAFGILKDRDPNSNNSQWQVFHTTAGDKYGYLSTNAAFAGTAEFYPTSGSSTTVTIARTGGVIATTNENGDRFVMYLFAPVAGYSAFGSYTGNNSTDGPFIYLGFRPKFWMVKRTDSTGDWYIYDSSRSPYNAGIETLAPSQNFGESSFGSLNYFDLLSNGLKIRQNSTNGYANVLNATYIYAAFAENPFKYSLAR